ncbi:MAG: hypothetical protein HQ513_15495 [Rhodospirillales bacterium]|nr:hypothetical protein [Rhodospirillales bacterium]
MNSGSLSQPVSLLPYLLMRVLPVAAIMMAATGLVGLKVTQDIAEEKADDLLARQSQHTGAIVKLRLEYPLADT